MLVDSELYTHIEEAETANEMWKILAKAFDNTGLTSRINLLMRLCLSRLEQFSTMEEYVNDKTATIHQLNGTNWKIDDELFGALLLCGLPDEYKPMIMAIESSGVTISSDFIKTKLTQEAVSKIGDSDKMKVNALFTKKNNNNRYRSKNQNQKKDVKCFICGREGHYAAKCPDNSIKKTGSVNVSYVCSAVLQKIKTNDWFVDSGASAHMTHRRDLIRNTREVIGADVTCANGANLKVESVGEVIIYLNKRDGQKTIATVKNVLLVPELHVNLLSVTELTKNSWNVLFSDSECKILTKSGDVSAFGKLSNSMYKLELNESFSLSVFQNNEQELWHRRFGHIGFENLNKMCKGFVDGMNLRTVNRNKCEVCLMGKQTRCQFSESNSKTTKLLELIHTDLCGPMKVEIFPDVSG